MSNTNRVRLSYFPETVFDTVPATPAMKILRYTGEGLKLSTATVTSNEINSTRDITGVYRTGLNTDGPINFEFSGQTFDDFLQWSLCSAGWSTASTITATSATFDGAARTLSQAALTAVPVNQWIKVTGFTDARLNGLFKVLSKAGSVLTLNGTSITGLSQTATATVVVGSQIVNGVTPQTFIVERSFLDLSGSPSDVFTGTEIDQLSINIASKELVTGSVTTMGSRMLANAAPITGATYTAPTTTRVMSSVDDVDGIFENNVQLPSKSFSMQLSNNVRMRDIIGYLGVESMGEGEVAVTGSISTYFKDPAIKQRYVNFTNTGVAFIMLDADGYGYAFDMPRCNLTQNTTTAGAKNTDVMGDINYSAYKHPVEGITIRVTRFVP